MSTQLLIQFIIFNILNVIIQTIKSVATIKCNKGWAAIINAIAYGFYTYIIVLTMCDLPLFWKAGIVALCNLIGVYIVKWGEEKARKDKIWLVKMTIPIEYAEQVKLLLKQDNIPFTYYDLTKYIVFDTFCETQSETAIVTSICTLCKGKAFATENKLGL